MKKVRFAPKVLKRNEYDLATVFRANRIFFKWDDWLLCEVAFDIANVPHHAIVSSFRDCGDTITCDLWNPSYSSLMKDVKISNLSHFKPIEIISLPRIKF